MICDWTRRQVVDRKTSKKKHITGIKTVSCQRELILSIFNGVCNETRKFSKIENISNSLKVPIIAEIPIPKIKNLATFAKLESISRIHLILDFENILICIDKNSL